MPRGARVKREVLLRQDPFVWGLSGAYIVGIIMAGIMSIMLNPLSLESNLNYNKSSASELDSAAVKTSVITNGSFETPVTTSPSNIVKDSTSGFGWQVWSVNTAGAWEPGAEILSGYDGWVASEGSQFARLDTFGAGAQSSLIGLRQTVSASTGKYLLTFDFAAQPKTPASENQLTVKWNGQVLAVVTEDGSKADKPNWQHYASEVTVEGSIGTLEFIAGGTENSKGVLLDNVSLVAQ